MTTWIIEPHEPLIFRDARPFGPTPGARAKSLAFPFPSTTTGGVRNRAGCDEYGEFGGKDGKSVEELIQDVKTIAVGGPLLVQLDQESGDIDPAKVLLPAPTDALLFEKSQKEGAEQTGSEEACELTQLVPLTLLQGALTDFVPAGEQLSALHLIGLTKSDPRKPHKKAPRYWYWEQFQQWLLAPGQQVESIKSTNELGHNGPQPELRVHVAYDPDSRAGKEHALFDTSGIEFSYPGKKARRISETQPLALAVIVDEKIRLQEGLACLGSERRIVCWRKSQQNLLPCPDTLEDIISDKGACRLFLLTPAYFKKGYYPTTLLEPRAGVTPRLQGIAIQRPQVVSGWDMEKKAGRATRRLAPAGTVIFLKLEGNKEDIRQWIRGTWLHCVSDTEQECHDGFGLAILGAWSGHPEQMS